MVSPAVGDQEASVITLVDPERHPIVVLAQGAA